MIKLGFAVLRACCGVVGFTIPTCSAVCFKSVNADTRDVTYATPMPTMYRSDFEVYRQHIAGTTSGIEFMSGGSKRLPCTANSDDMGNWTWICEGLVIVFLTETAVIGERRQREKQRVSVLGRVEELAIHSFSQILLAELKQENAHPKREEGDQV